MIALTTTPTVAAAWGAVIIAGTAGEAVLEINIAGRKIYEPVVGGAFISDISVLARPALFSPGYPSSTPGNAAVKTNIVLTEINQDGDPAGTLTVSDVVFHRATELRTMSTAAPGLMLQDIGVRRVLSGVKIPIGGITSEAAVKVNGATVTPTNGRFQVFADATGASFAAAVFNTEEPAVLISNQQVYNIDSTCYPNAVTLYWLNRYGGYEVYSFIDSEAITQKGESIRFRSINQQGVIVNKKLPTDSYQEVALIGRLETKSSAAYLRDLATSPEVFMSDGTPVLVDMDSVDLYADGEFRPTVTIIKDVTRCIGY